MKELTTQEKEFCRLCVIQRNKSKAYRQAGLLTEEQNPEHISQYAYNLYRKDYIQAYIRALKDKIEADDKMLEQQTIDKAQRLQDSFDVAQWFEDVTAGKILDRGEEAKLTDRIQAGRTYAQIKGLLTNKTEVSGDIVIDVVFDDE